jgi:hypothetical protein
VVAVLALIACPPQNLPKPVPPAPAPQPGFTPPDEPPPRPGSGSSATAGGGATGAACTAGADCASGICEGEGCGAGQGKCAAAKRACTYDLQTYCGCDGNTFDASGTCPERRYSHRGACQAAGSGSASGGPLPTGAPCLAASECESGICEGKGCGADAPGKCAAATRACTRDRRTFCGCDGVTFFGSGSCPGKRYSDTAACPSK